MGIVYKKRVIISILMLTSLAILHALVDAVCASSVLGAIADGVSYETLLCLVVVYNSLAFCTQWLTGLLLDKTGRDRFWLFVSLALLVCGALLPLPVYAAVVLLGIGNSFFHVSAGRYVILDSGGKAVPLGMFVAPGALGLGAGSLFPHQVAPWAVTGLILLGGAVFFLSGRWTLPETRPAEKEKPVWNQTAFWCIVLVLFNVFGRSAAGGAVAPVWKETMTGFVLFYFLVFAGKFTGGFLMDKLGIVKTTSLAMISGVILLYFFQERLAFSLAAQYAVNLMMPITLYMMVACCRHRPGLMFGLAASVLYPGSLISGFQHSFAVFLVLYLVCYVALLTVAALLKRK